MLEIDSKLVEMHGLRQTAFNMKASAAVSIDPKSKVKILKSSNVTAKTRQSMGPLGQTSPVAGS